MNQVEVKNMPALPYAMEEALNRLRINIGFLGSKVRKIMVISTLPNEGKSFVAMQLWHQMAETGTSCALLDVDLRKSVMYEKYEVSRRDGKKLLGMSHYLSGDMELEDALCQTQWEDGILLPNTDNVINPSMLLESDKFAQMLEETAEKCRYVFLDSPPLSMVSDGERIGNLCDGAILVVRGGITPKNAVRDSIRQLERAGCPLLGIVLNRVETAKSGYYSKKYGGRYYGRYGKYYGSKYYSDTYYGENK